MIRSGGAEIRSERRP